MKLSRKTFRKDEEAEILTYKLLMLGEYVENVESLAEYLFSIKSIYHFVRNFP